MRALSRPAQAYICLVVAVALAVIVLGSTQGVDWPTIVVLAFVFAVCESASTPLAGRNVHVSISFSVALASVVLVGPFGAAIVGAAGALALRHGGRPVVRRAFNGAQYALSAFAAGLVYLLTHGPEGFLGPDDFPWVLLPFAAAVVTYCVVNALLIACVLWLTEGMRPLQVWSGVLSQSVLPYLGYGTFGLLIAALWASIGPLTVLLVLLPLFVARWAFGQYAAQQAAYDATIAALCQAVETKDYYTRGHSERVARASVMIAREVGMREERVTALRYAGMLHDVGKLGVPTKVLQKTGPLTEEEFAAIQLHPMRGLEIVREIDFLDEALAGIVHHHERIDGRGYPMGLAGDAIPEFARVIAVADAFDSMTSTRSYRAARTVAEAIGELRRWAGTQFDGVMVEALIRAVGREGWDRPILRPWPADGPAEAVHQDHDDPSAPLRVTGSEPAL